MGPRLPLCDIMLPVIAQTRSFIFLFLPNLLIRPMPRLTTLPHPFTRNRNQLSGRRSHFTRLTSSHRSTPTDASPPGNAAAAPQAIPSATTLPHPPQGTTPWDILVAPCAEPDISESLSTASTPTPASVKSWNLTTQLPPPPLFPCSLLRPSSASPIPPLPHRPVYPRPMQGPLPSSATRHYPV
ncbi:hypothetical protein DFH94DRAFT_772084 [Russula ochroleuca]|uniref:Uncharacterized protein n=1 Tax=Russula ochroleuca TaxID=152965 RepID=A0A9P5JYZ8_9AGAM|nr:hypothetical protein DFH94DRAFT_772084 [Russula ochroleuca]